MLVGVPTKFLKEIVDSVELNTGLPVDDYSDEPHFQALLQKQPRLAARVAAAPEQAPRWIEAANAEAETEKTAAEAAALEQAVVDSSKAKKKRGRKKKNADASK